MIAYALSQRRCFALGAYPMENPLGIIEAILHALAYLIERAS
jgi:hypothetical protein